MENLEIQNGDSKMAGIENDATITTLPYYIKSCSFAVADVKGSITTLTTVEPA